MIVHQAMNSVKTEILNKLFSENHSLVREYQKASVRLVLTGLKAARINFKSYF